MLLVVVGVAAAAVSAGELHTMTTLTQGAVGTGVERIAKAGKAAIGNGVARAAIETREQLAHVLWNTSLHTYVNKTREQLDHVLRNTSLHVRH